MKIKFLSFLKREYGGHFYGDLSGGITTAVVALPLALAFAIASGVDAKYGLYTAIVTGFIAAAVGGSKVQVSGPTGGMAAVLVAVTARYGYQNVVLIALIAGFMQMAAGFLKLGRFVKMLPFPLVAGFTMGIAIVILGSQVDNILGIQVHHERTEFFDRIQETINAASITGINAWCVLIALSIIVFMMIMSRASKRMPAALIGVIIASLAAWLFKLNVPEISDIPRYLPHPHFPAFSWNMFRNLLRPAATVAALGSIESLLAAVVADNILADGSRHDSNRELIGQGFANISTSFFGGIPCTGAIARTAVNIKSGGRTRLAAIIHSIFLLSALLFLAPFATYIPICALAGILIVTAIRMVEWRDVGWLMTAPKSDIIIMLITVLVTIFTDLVMAVEFGLIAAGILFIKKMSETTPTLISGQTDISRDSQSSSLDHDHIRIFRIPGPLFWGDSHAVIEALEECENTQVVILKMQLVTHIDASGAAILREAKHRFSRFGITLFLVNVPERTLKILTKMGITREFGHENIFPTLETAKAAAFAKLKFVKTF